MTASQMTEQLKRFFPFWGRLSPDEQAFLVQSTSETHYEKGGIIHSGEQKCVGVLPILRGEVRAFLLSEEGREVTLYRLYAGDVCMLSASCVLKDITFDVHIDAQEDCDMLLIRSCAFQKLAEGNVYVDDYTHRVLTERFSDVMWAMQQILFMSFDRRLAVFLLDELSKTRGDTLKITHEQAAKLMGSAREVVTRMLKYFAAEGIVSLSRGGITVLSRQRLYELTEGK